MSQSCSPTELLGNGPKQRQTTTRSPSPKFLFHSTLTLALKEWYEKKKLDSQQFFFRKREAKKLNKWNVINNSSSHGWMGARRHQAGLKWIKKREANKNIWKNMTTWQHGMHANVPKMKRKNCCSACSRLCIMDDSIGLEYRWEQTHTARWLQHISALFFRTAYFGLHRAPHTELQNMLHTFFLSDKLISIFISLPKQHGIDENLCWCLTQFQHTRTKQFFFHIVFFFSSLPSRLFHIFILCVCLSLMFSHTARRNGWRQTVIDRVRCVSSERIIFTFEKRGRELELEKHIFSLCFR